MKGACAPGTHGWDTASAEEALGMLLRVSLWKDKEHSSLD